MLQAPKKKKPEEEINNPDLEPGNTEIEVDNDDDLDDDLDDDFEDEDEEV